MNDDLRTCIAAVQAQHHHWDYAGALTCACGEDFGLSNDGWEAAVKEWSEHVADAVIRELEDDYILVPKGHTIARIRSAEKLGLTGDGR